MSRHHYPPSVLAPDYIRAGAGLFLSGGPLLLADPSPVMASILAGLVFLFFLYFVRTVARQMWQFELTENGMTVAGPFAKSLKWDDLDAVQLRYFSTRRDRKGGWMQLKLAASGTTLRVDSGVTDFAAIAARAAGEAERRGLPLSEATRANLASLGPAFAPSPPRDLVSP